MNTDVQTLHPVEAHALWAETYDRAPNPVLALEERIISPLLPSLQGMLVLDLACGTGRWLARFTRQHATAVGVDISPPMLRQASMKPGLKGWLIQADCEAVPVGTGTADVVICSFGLSYISDLRVFATECSRTARESSHLFITDLHPETEARGWKRRFRHNDAVVEIANYTRPVDEICEAFTAAGYELLSQIEAEFGEPEKPIFEQCGRADLFSRALGGPAIFLCHFMKTRDLRRCS